MPVLIRRRISFTNKQLVVCLEVDRDLHLRLQGPSPRSPHPPALTHHLPFYRATPLALDRSPAYPRARRQAIFVPNIDLELGKLASISVKRPDSHPHGWKLAELNPRGKRSGRAGRGNQVYLLAINNICSALEQTSVGSAVDVSAIAACCSASFAVVQTGPAALEAWSFAECRACSVLAPACELYLPYLAHRRALSRQSWADKVSDRKPQLCRAASLARSHRACPIIQVRAVAIIVQEMF